MTEIPEPHARVIRGDSRRMAEMEEESVDLVVTSPPYWQIKDYGAPGQIGYGQSLHEYLFDLSRVWRECARVLRPGRRLCVNIGDQFARAAIYGRYKIIPLHAEVIAQCAAIGLDFLGSIIWQKKTTMNTTGGAVVMGSFPHPPNGIVELDYEYILLFKKPGPSPKVSPACREASKLSTEEWKQFFSGHWTFGGARQTGSHEAMFPDELPRRLVRMFSFVGETVLDPFLGSGTTTKVALELDRSAVGYEINEAFLPIIREKLCPGGVLRLITPSVSFHQQTQTAESIAPPEGYTPHAEDAQPLRDPKQFRFGPDQIYKVVEIVDERTLRLDTDLVITLLGLIVPSDRVERARDYLRTYLLNKAVLVKFEEPPDDTSVPLPVYLQLANKLFVNRKMIEMGLAVADRTCQHRLRNKFLAAEEGGASDAN